MKKLKFPTAQTILIIIAALTMLLTWFIPAGKYDTLAYDKASDSFVITTPNGTETIAATQENLAQRKIEILIEKFQNEDIRKPINIPNTYQKIEAKPQTLVDFIQSPIKGIIQASDIIFFVLIIGGLVGIMNITGAFNAGINWLAEKLKGKEYLLIIFITLLIALGGTTFGLAEETIAFYPILIPVFLAAKYDAMVALASIYLGSSIGTMFSTVNPFSTIIASNAAGINWTTGIEGRIIALIIGTIICIAYIIWYANKVKKDATKSVIFEENKAILKHYESLEQTVLQLNIRLKLILFLFLMAFVVMIYGVSQLGWWFTEMSSVFLVAAVLIGFVAKIKEKDFISSFITGAADLLGVALIIGIARGVSVIMEEGFISDTLLYYASNFTSGMNEFVFVNSMLVTYGGLSFFIPSSSGMAVLTMPIMAPLADSFGLGREVIVNAYQCGMGLFAFINPTGLILASLAMINVGYNKWLKFVMPLVFILLIYTILILTLSIYI
ncbi:YfcC family protein [Flavobacterium sp. U410]